MSSDKVVDFAQGSRQLKNLLGGKGANIAEMIQVLGADRVPAGFTITTDVCVEYMRGDELPQAEIQLALGRLEQRAGKRLGDRDNPLLVSVRSGARESMPGMMDTILNLGLNSDSVEGLARQTEDPRFAWDSYRRLIQMYGSVVAGIESHRFEAVLAARKQDEGVEFDSDLSAEALAQVCSYFLSLYDFPQDPKLQLDQAIRAVFDSWGGDRAVTYRRIHHIPDEWGTAVNVQQMVFGNRGETSGSGVAFSRDEMTGARTPSGDFLINAQGEDVVSGMRTPRDIAELAELLPEVHADLMAILRRLEAHYGDMQDTEFTIEQGRLYMLQTRSAKRPAQAAVRFAVDAVEEGLLSREQAILTIDASRLDALLHPTFDPDHDFKVLTRGVAASPGAAAGRIVFTAQAAIEAEEDVILVRPFTEADDIAGFQAARGILTSEGGKASHAALVARGMGVPAVTGAGELEIDPDKGEVRKGETLLRAGDWISIDGSRGIVTQDRVRLVEPQISEALEQVLAWSDELRRLRVRANADTPEEARKARQHGAEGIGLCRTEHMFLGERQRLMAATILAEDEASRRQKLVELRAMQVQDFGGIFKEMAGLPVTIRLLDPPLHEFLPPRVELELAVQRCRLEGSEPDAKAVRMLDRVRKLEEANPMLGMRGVRLGLVMPEIYEMQMYAICEAIRGADPAPQVEVMIPLTAYEGELGLVKERLAAVAREMGLEPGRDFLVGTMIELPRACMIADLVSAQADFFSFGTNDLTQTTIGVSRDDIEARILDRYIDSGILDRSPFETIDEPGVGQLVRMGAWLGRKGRDDLKLGVCGEHGGDPDSIDFFHRSGIDYVSCSAYRLPIARLAAAQSAVRHGRSDAWT